MRQITPLQRLHRRRSRSGRGGRDGGSFHAFLGAASRRGAGGGFGAGASGFGFSGAGFFLAFFVFVVVAFVGGGRTYESEQGEGEQGVFHGNRQDEIRNKCEKPAVGCAP